MIAIHITDNPDYGNVVGYCKANRLEYAMRTKGNGGVMGMIDGKKVTGFSAASPEIVKSYKDNNIASVDMKAVNEWAEGAKKAAKEAAKKTESDK